MTTEPEQDALGKGVRRWRTCMDALADTWPTVLLCLEGDHGPRFRRARPDDPTPGTGRDGPCGGRRLVAQLAVMSPEPLCGRVADAAASPANDAAVAKAGAHRRSATGDTAADSSCVGLGVGGALGVFEFRIDPTRR